MWNARSVFLILSAAIFAVNVVANPEVLIARQASSTSSASDASPTPVFLFLNDNSIQPLTCQSVRISWFYGGPEGTINLYVSNVGVSQAGGAPPLSSSSSRSSSRQGRPTDIADQTTEVTKVIGTNIDVDSMAFVWSRVDVPPGWYILNASMPALSYRMSSLPFYVYTGSDTSCLPSHSLSTTKSVSHAPTATSTSATLAPLATTSGPSEGNGSHLDPMPLGAILGASLGGFALLVAIVILYFWCIKRRRGKPARSHGGSDYPSSSPHWKLGSADSRGTLRKVEPRSHIANDSLGTVIYSDETGGAEKSSICSKIDFTVLTHEPASTLAAIPALMQHPSIARISVLDRPRSTISLVSNNLPLDNTEPSPKQVLVHHTSKLSMDSMTYPPASPAVLPSIQHIPTQSTTAQDESVTVHQPPAPVTPDGMKTLHRQSTGRKRKPVPIYDENEDISALSSAPARPISALPLSPTEAFLAGSPPPNSVSHYVTRKQSTPDIRPELAHKNSFGTGVKPLHYIIPDMPPLPK